MHRSREIKKRLERLLRLEIEPDMLDLINHRVEHDFADFHRRRPRRGVVLDEAFRRYAQLSCGLRQGHVFDQTRWRLYEERQAWRALATTRKVTYHAWTVGVEGSSVDMDGYLEMGGCAHHLTLDLVSVGAIEQEAREAWDSGKVSTHGGSGAHAEAQKILLPDRVLSEQCCAEAVRRWYRSRFEWTRRHWTHEEMREPDFVFDWHWEELPPAGDAAVLAKMA